MKKLVKTSRTAAYLEKLFRELNHEFFAGEEISEPIITMQSTPNAYGHVSVYEVWERGQERTRELNISTDSLKRPIENIAATMLHEMTHLYNLEHGVKDTSNQGVYHNRKFKEEAERRGLVIEHNQRYGWSITKVSDRLMNWILETGWTEIDMERGFSLGGVSGTGGKDGKGNGVAGTTPKKSSTRKYQCPCCGNSVRATKDLKIICGDCNVEFTKV